jgi:hypothetical protein
MTPNLNDDESDRIDTLPSPAQISLQPITAPSIPGLYGFAGATLIPSYFAAGYAFIVSAIIAWWVASAMMFEEAYGHPIMGLGRKRPRRAAVTIATGEPGVIRGQ